MKRIFFILLFMILNVACSLNQEKLDEWKIVSKFNIDKIKPCLDTFIQYYNQEAKGQKLNTMAIFFNKIEDRKILVIGGSKDTILVEQPLFEFMYKNTRCVVNTPFDRVITKAENQNKKNEKKSWNCRNYIMNFDIICDTIIFNSCGLENYKIDKNENYKKCFEFF